MPRTCSVCLHPERSAIDQALMRSDSYRDIAGQYNLSRSALTRHKAEHIPPALADAVEAERIDQAVDVMGELRDCLAFAKKLRAACDDWLTDPDDPDRYTLDPRDNEITVVYWEYDGGKKRRCRAKLSYLLKKVARQTDEVEVVETKHADPRELILKALGRLQGHLELLAELQGELDRRAQFNITVSPDWQALRAELLDALLPFSEARVAVAERLVALERVNGR